MAGPSVKHLDLADLAIEESSDVDSDFAQSQKALNQKKRAMKDSPEARLKKVFPFRFVPLVKPLTISDLDSAVALENAAFTNPEHRASADKIAYRLTVCGELSLGVFCTVVPSELNGWHIETLDTAREVETGRYNGALNVLVAHIVGTKCIGETITDKDMAIPEDWRTRKGKPADVGHQEVGTTVAIHSLAVSPKLQGCRIGQLIIKAFLQQMFGSGVVDRVSLLCQEHLVAYYVRCGFENKGPSDAQFGGGGWYNMVFTFKRSRGPPGDAEMQPLP
ncbi:hypothetical protein QBC47DRAFT_195473 [Echria macrotheca]|uniref:N-acetyltransferase domain-containing protein n=1 Tax=Echria macrotheca TaxID=438768 RepID=A0AAJ0BH35_9PEZI|nr:hypothetical protein QBC47DRAFT_195473 [Echria macrotheca]